MSRSTKKGPFISAPLKAKIDKLNLTREKKVIRTWARASVIYPDMVGHTIGVHDGRKHVPRAPRKARLVADSVKGMKVTEALAYLEFSPKHAARDVAKAIKSAAANAEHNFN